MHPQQEACCQPSIACLFRSCLWPARRSEDALVHLSQVSVRTVVLLNETQLFCHSLFWLLLSLPTSFPHNCLAPIAFPHPRHTLHLTSQEPCPLRELLGVGVRQAERTAALVIFTEIFIAQCAAHKNS
jgi:hypothetical protein